MRNTHVVPRQRGETDGYGWPGWALDALRGIEPHEVVQALGARRRWPRKARGRDGTEVLTVWARTISGRPLIVAVRQVGEPEWPIVGAREMRVRERSEFVRWEGTRDD
jgi:hypothetical protein